MDSRSGLQLTGRCCTFGSETLDRAFVVPHSQKYLEAVGHVRCVAAMQCGCLYLDANVASDHAAGGRVPKELDEIQPAGSTTMWLAMIHSK